jgi:hypothetical protein
MTSCETHELTIEAILADQMVRLVMRRDGISDEQMRDVLLRARTAVLRRQAEADA